MKLLFKIFLTLMLAVTSLSLAQTSIQVTPEQGLRLALEFAASNNVDSIILITSGGVYTEVDTFNFQIRKPVTIVAKPGLAEKPILTNSNPDGKLLEIIRVSDDLTLDGVILDGGHPTSYGMKYGIRVGPTIGDGVPAKKGLNVTVRNVDFKNFYEGGTGQGHAFYFLKDVEAGTIRIEDCTINGTGYEAIRMSETEKYAVERCLDSLIIRNVTFENVAAECIRFYADLDTATTDAYVLMEHLTVNKCNARMAFIKNNKNSIMRNVIITNDFDGGSISGQNRVDYIMDVQSTGSIVSHIDTFNVFPITIKSTKGGTVDAATIYGFDPMYEDPDNGNFTLLSGSPAYGKAHDGTALGDLRWATNPPTSVREINVNKKIDSYKLEQNYPNPFNPSTKISFNLPKAGFVNLSVYNVLGHLVEVLINKEMEAGAYEFNFNASKLKSGVYFYTINSGNFKRTKKMVLIR